MPRSTRVSTTNSTRLLPCPWCSSVPTVEQNTDGQYWIGCMDDSCAINPYSNENAESDAVAAWNARDSVVDRDAQAVFRECLKRIDMEWVPGVRMLLEECVRRAESNG